MLFGIGFVLEMEAEAQDVQLEETGLEEAREVENIKHLADENDSATIAITNVEMETGLTEREAVDSAQKQKAQDSVDMKSSGNAGKPVIEKVYYDFEDLEYSDSDYFEGELSVRMSGNPGIERYVYSSNRTDFDGSDYTGYNWTDNFDLYGIPAYVSDIWYVWAVDKDGNVSDMYTLRRDGFSREYYDDGQIPVENPGNIGNVYFDDAWRGKGEHELEVYIDEKDEKRMIEGEDYTKISFIDKKGNIVYIITGKGKYYGTVIRTFDQGYPYKTMDEIRAGFIDKEYQIVDLTAEPEIKKLYSINENGWWSIAYHKCLEMIFPQIGTSDSGTAGFYISYDDGKTWRESPGNTTYINDGKEEMYVGPDNRSGENLKFSYMFVYQCWEGDERKVYITKPSESIAYKRDRYSPLIKKASYDGKGHIVVEATDELSGLWRYACSQNEEYLFYHPSDYVTGEDSSIPVNANGKWYVRVSDKAGHWTEPVEVDVSGLGSGGKTEGSENDTGTQAEDGKNIRVSKIKLSGISKKIAAGKKIKLTADITPTDASNKEVAWASGNNKVATVNSAGVVAMKKKSGGKSVIITATAKDGSGVKATYKITSMKGAVKKVAVSGKKSVKAGKTLKLRAKVTAAKSANKKLKWTSSNKKYATVSSSGKVKALKAGKGKNVKITTMATDGSGKKKTIVIKIK